MYRRFPGNILIIFVCITLAIFFLLKSHILPSSIPQYLPSSTIVPSIIHFQDQLCLETATATATKTLPLTTTASCSCPNSTSTPPPIPQHNILDQLTQEEEAIARLRAAGIVIIFKTGAQELPSLAIQLSTTLRYLSPSDILFFSDHQGSLGPFILHDALRNVDQDLKENDPDFQIYRAIRRYQKTGQDIEELKEARSKGDGRSGWRLDKYKFIHMVEQTFEKRPDAKWYVFIETDSYLFLDNVASFLSRFDSTKPIYLGSSVWSGSVSFAHGGSGYALSNAAMNKLLGPEQPQGLAASWDQRMKGYCCGDIALAEALQEKGIILTVAHPMLNGYKPTTFTYGPNNHWCQPVVNMHHMLPHEISSVWRYERRREMLVEKPNATIFAELYAHFVEPHLTESRDDWDNLSHGPTYMEPSTSEKEDMAQKFLNHEKARKEAEEREKEQEKEMKAKAEKEREYAKSAEKEKEKEDGKSDGKSKDDSKDKKPSEKEKEKEKEEKKQDQSDAKKADEGKKKDDRFDKDSDTKTKTEDKQEEKKRQKRADDEEQEEDEDDNTTLKAAEKVAWRSFDNCRQVCEANKKCFQFVYYDKTCKLGLSFRLGKHVEPSEDGKTVWKSGWLVDRIREWTRVHACHGPEWPDIVPNGLE